MGELNDVFAEIGLDRFQMVVFEPLVQIDLFGRHRFRFDDQRRALLLG